MLNATLLLHVLTSNRSCKFNNINIITCKYLSKIILDSMKNQVNFSLAKCRNIGTSQIPLFLSLLQLTPFSSLPRDPEPRHHSLAPLQLQLLTITIPPHSPFFFPLFSPLFSPSLLHSLIHVVKTSPKYREKENQRNQTSLFLRILHC